LQLLDGAVIVVELKQRGSERVAQVVTVAIASGSQGERLFEMAPCKRVLAGETVVDSGEIENFRIMGSGSEQAVSDGTRNLWIGVEFESI
jgi:hypothetical protein